MRILPARDVAAALLRKGFEKRENDHTYFHFKYEGREVGVITKISHGEREIRLPLIKRMRMQLRLETNSQFERFIQCPLTHAEYVALLKSKAIIKD